MTIEQLLLSLGINIASNAIYDLIKQYFNQVSAPTTQGLRDFLAPHLMIENANIKAAKIIDFLARNGDIIIQGSNIFASQSITMASSNNTKLTFGDGSVSAIDKTRIEAGYGAQIISQGGAKIVQGDDGSISFYT